MQDKYVKDLFQQAVAAHESYNLLEARKKYKSILTLRPDSIETLNNLGVLYEQSNNINEAINCHLKVLKLKPDYVESHYNIANCYYSLGEYILAIRAYRETLNINSHHSRAMTNLGNAYIVLGEYEKAQKNYLNSFREDPNSVNNILQLANCYNLQEEYAKAITYYQQSLRCSPMHNEALANCYFLALKICDFELADKLSLQLNKSTLDKISKQQPVQELPLINVTRTDDKILNLQNARNYSYRYDNIEKLNITTPILKKDNLRIGFVSNDFYDHATMHILYGVLKEMFNTKHKVFLYSYTREPNIDLPLIDINNLSDQKAAQRIADDDLDCLIDLKGHTKDNRLRIFAYRPCKIQMTYLGYPGTTGANFIDYIIADKYVLRETSQKFYIENVLYLDCCYQSYMIPKNIPNFTREELGLPKGTIYASFNQSFKLNKEVLELWFKILKQKNNSYLWLLEDNITANFNILELAKKNSLDKRIIFAKKVSRVENLARLALADIYLDPFLYNGHTSTTDAIVSKLPVVTLSGNHFASRVCGAILHSLSLSKYIAMNHEEYIELAVKLGTNHEFKKKYKSEIKEKIKTATNFDSNKYAKAFISKLLDVCRN